MAIANDVFQYPAYNWVYCFTDDYLPTTSSIKINGVNAKQFVTYTAANGWSPAVGAASQGVIGFTYTPNTFILGDTFVVSTSSGDSTISDYGPVTSSGMVLYYDASLNYSYSGTGTTWYNIATAGSYTGTLSGGAVYNSGDGGSILFDGVDDVVSVGSSTGLNFTNSTGTISIWMKTSVVSQSGYLISKNMDSTGGWGLAVHTDGTTYFETKNNASGGSAAYRFSNTVVNDNVWHNIVIVFTTSTTVVANNTISLYIDGALAQGTLTQSLVYGGNTAKGVELGRRYQGNYYSGYIANVQIWEKGLTGAQVFQNYNYLKTRFNVGGLIPAKGLVLNLNANNSKSFALNSSTWNDISGTGNNGSISGSLFNYLNGGSFTFDGINDETDAGNGASLKLTQGTLCVWMKTTSKTVAYQAIVTKALNYGIYNYGGNLLLYDWANAVNRDSGVSISDGTWKSLILTFTSAASNNAKVYINGVLVFTTTMGKTSDTYNLYVGGTGGGQYFPGSIGEVQVYNRVLSLYEIQNLYNVSKPRYLSFPFGIYSNLVQYVDVGNKQSYIGTGSTLSDVSGAGTNNTLENSPTFLSEAGGILQFNGTSQRVNMGSSTYLNVVNFTFSIWVLVLTGGADDQYLAVRWSNTNSSNGWLFIFNQVTRKFYIQGQEAASVFTLTSTNTYSRDTWYNVTGTKSGSTWSLYVNGVLDKSESLGVGTSAFLTNTLYLAGTFSVGGNYYSNCKISQARFYSRALTLEEIQNNYNTYKSRYP